MSSAEIYEEAVTFRLLAVIVIALLAFVSGVCIYTYALERDLVSIWILAATFAFGLAILANFSRLTIRVTGSGITVSFGRIRASFDWSKVEGFCPDTSSAIRYGGFGVRAGRHEGRSRLVFSVPGAPRIALKVRGEKYDEFVFSTRQPEELGRALMSMGVKPLGD